jgi:CRP/FNR family transcriptional regulator
VEANIEVFRKAELFRDLPDDALRNLTKHAVEKRLARNEILFVAGDTAAGLYLVAEGAIRAFRSGIDGREQIIHVERAVTTLAEPPVFDNGTYPSTTAAEEPSKVFFIPKDKVRAACFEHPELALAAASLMATRLRRCAELVESLSLREVGQRLAQLLLDEAAVHGKETADGVVFTQRLTHNQLAARIGTVREVVTRVFFRFQQQGLLYVAGKRMIIPDAEALALYADSILSEKH